MLTAPMDSISEGSDDCEFMAYIGGQTTIQTGKFGKHSIIVSSIFKNKTGNKFPEGIDANPVMAFEGDNGTEYIAATIGDWTNWEWKAIDASSAECTIDKAFDCVWSYVDSNNRKNPF